MPFRKVGNWLCYPAAVARCCFYEGITSAPSGLLPTTRGMDKGMEKGGHIAPQPESVGTLGPLSVGGLCCGSTCRCRGHFLSVHVRIVGLGLVEVCQGVRQVGEKEPITV